MSRPPGWDAVTTSTQPQTDRRFFGHPKGLANLFGTEMWERFSFYGMQAILLYYLYYTAEQGGLGMDEGVASGIVGAYGGSVYLATIAGSWVADRLFGPERTLFYSGVLILLGHLSLAVLPGLTGVACGLVLVALGSGGLKATATTIVGMLYAQGDERRDAGFSIFYMGVNLGALVGPLLTGLLQTRLGFHYGFGLAAIGMAAGLVQYTLGRRNLPEQGRVVPNPITSAARIRTIGLVVGFAVVIALLLITGVITKDNLADVVTIVIAVAAIALFVVILSSSRVDQVERQRVVAFIPLFLVSFAFWALFQQQFTVLAIYADERLDLNVFGWNVPPSWFNSVEPLFVVLLAPVFAWLWTRLGDRQPSTPVKFALGAIGMGVAFLIMAAMGFIGGKDSVNPFLLVGVLIVFVLAELNLSPIGLSLSTKLSPEAFRAQMVALFYLSIALGTSVAGKLADYYHADENETPYFGLLGIVALVIGLALLAFVPKVRALMHGVR
ncbi:POT family proton-dependent oligopeptide transporter [Labedaea rhizosphaerae]|uniref:POT family proton-dependent oligopeptide transporter n=1 Tax=Labedaea rhizosphaerae TaxID=598644 RepID=A0A4V3D084_LABRH|nr:POT family proton-dependent oligopeptide transporter [Labedaea rhizosphaerae]